MAEVKVKIKLIDGGKMPVFKTKGAVAADCYAHISNATDNTITIAPKKRALVPLGFALGLPEGWEVQVRPRSGLTSKSTDIGLGTGDWDYTGEYKACVINNSGEPFVIHNGDRICQIAIREAPTVIFEEVDELSETERGANGFGSTGV